VKLGRPKIEYAWRTALFPSKGPLDDAAGKPIENSSRSFQTSAFPFSLWPEIETIYNSVSRL
jgi:hypothetical protein